MIVNQITEIELEYFWKKIDIRPIELKNGNVEFEIYIPEWLEYPVFILLDRNGETYGMKKNSNKKREFMNNIDIDKYNDIKYNFLIKDKYLYLKKSFINSYEDDQMPTLRKIKNALKEWVTEDWGALGILVGIIVNQSLYEEDEKESHKIIQLKKVMGLEFKIIEFKDKCPGVLRKRISVLEYIEIYQYVSKFLEEDSNYNGDGYEFTKYFMGAFIMEL